MNVCNRKEYFRINRLTTKQIQFFNLIKMSDYILRHIVEEDEVDGVVYYRYMFNVDPRIPLPLPIIPLHPDREPEEFQCIRNVAAVSSNTELAGDDITVVSPVLRQATDDNYQDEITDVRNDTELISDGNILAGPVTTQQADEENQDEILSETHGTDEKSPVDTPVPTHLTD